LALYRFEIDGALLKSVINAYRQVVADFVWKFHKGGVFVRAMDTGHYMLIEMNLTPSSFQWFTPEEIWVLGDIRFVWDSVKKLKKGERVTVEVRDDKSLWFGSIKVASFTEEKDVWADYKMEIPKVAFAANFTVLTKEFTRIVKNAYEQGADKVIIAAHGPELTFMFLNTAPSRVDARYQPWLLNVYGDAESVYRLPQFSTLLFPDLAPGVRISLGSDLPCILEYTDAEFNIKLMNAPIIDTEEYKKMLVAPKPERRLILRMEKDLCGDFLSSLKAVDRLISNPRYAATPKLAPIYQMGLYAYWKTDAARGYVKFEYRSFDVFNDVGARLSAQFEPDALARFMRDVETLDLYLQQQEKVKNFVLVGRGPKIAEREMVLEAVEDVDVPKIEAVSVVSGPNKLLLRTVEDAKVSGDLFLVFYTRMSDIVAFGENAVYYTATFELDDFKIVEENQVPVAEDYFDPLIIFFRNVPSADSVVGRKDYNIYLKTSGARMEMEALIPQTKEMVEEALKRYEERIKPKPPPPEVKPLVVAPAPEEVFKELRARVSAVNEDYEKVALKFREEEEAFYKVEKKPKLEEVKRLIAFFTEIEPKLDPLKERYEPLRTQLNELYGRAKLELMREIDRVVKGEIDPNLRNVDFFKGRIIYLLPQLRRMERELEAVAPPPPAVPKLPKIPEEGITDEWLDEVRKISPEVKPEVSPQTDYTYMVLLNKYIEELKDTVPMGIMPAKTPPEVEEFLKTGTFDGWTWRPQDITYPPKYLEWKDIWFKKYSREELEKLKREQVDIIARVKGLSSAGTKEEVMSRILGIPVAKPPPEVKPPKPPKPPPVRISPEELEGVWQEFLAYARTVGVKDAEMYRERFEERIRTAVSVAQAAERARRLVSQIQRELRPPPERVPAILPEEMAEVYRRLKVPYGMPVSRATFETVWRAIQRERIPPSGLISSELDYLWREFRDHLQRYGLDAERYRAEFDEAVDRTLNLDENTEAVMRRAREITEPLRKPPGR